MQLKTFFSLAILSFLLHPCFSQGQEIMMDYHEYLGAQDNSIRQVMVWNSKTGESARYYYNDDSEWEKSNSAIPIQPLSTPSYEAGEIMMTYTEYNLKDYLYQRQWLVWNTMTGESARYYYDKKEGSWGRSRTNIPKEPIATSASRPGEVMMDYTQYRLPSGTTRRTMFVWNTRTGESARYYFDPQERAWGKSSATLPSQPLSRLSTEFGEIMMDYIQYPGDDEEPRAVLVWNTKTGETARYYYDHKNTSWEKSKNALPNRLLYDSPSEIGEIMMKYNQYLDEDGSIARRVLVWNTKTGESARYSLEGNWVRSASIPTQPLSKSSSKIGEIMMDYNEYLDGIGRAQIFVWNTKTGESMRYSYGSDKRWHKSNAALPSRPLQY